MTEIADPAAIRERTMKSLTVPMGLANPLWLAFGAAASAGAAWWLMTRWARPFNAEAVLASVHALAPASAKAEAPEKPAAAAAPVSVPPGPPAAAEAAPDPSLAPEPVAAAAETPIEAANEVNEAGPALTLEAVAETEDDLTRLVGVGPRTAAALAEHGVTRFAHLAAWTDEQMAAFDAELSLKGRSVRDAWRAQAQRLASE
jgi:predicted flap endonuclease-1-like 5' DNA nuclease